MMHIIEISENKMEHLGENVEKALKYMGKVMQCVEEMKEHSRMGERYEEDDEYDDFDDEEYEEYFCMMDLDEDEMEKFLTDSFNGGCPYYRLEDEYKTVRKQM